MIRLHRIYPSGTPARLFEIAETDMREMEMKKAQFSQKLVDAALHPLLQMKLPSLAPTQVLWTYAG